MKRPEKKPDQKKTAAQRKKDFFEFLKEFTLDINNGIHGQLEDSKKRLRSKHIPDYIDEENGLDVAAVESNENLTVRDVLEIGIHYARWNTHDQWHEVMDGLIEKHGVADDIHFEDGAKTEVKVINGLDQLPPELRDALAQALGVDKKGEK